MYDVLIIGSGPAGISAALYTVRANLKTLVLSGGAGALGGAETIENYYGFPGGISGAELAARGIAQVRELGGEVRAEEVLSITQAQDGLSVRTTAGEYAGRRLLLATGKTRNRTALPGLDRLLGRGVSMCAVCDGFFYRGKRLAILGNADYAVAEAKELTRFTSDLTVCTNGRDPVWSVPPKGVLVDTRPVLEVAGEARVERLRFAEGGDLEVDGVFVAEGVASASDFAVKMGILTEGNSIVVDHSFGTNVPGVYAAGDCIGGFLQISKAVSDGALSAKAIIKSLAVEANA